LWGGTDVREFCKKRWRDLLAMACVGAAWLIATVLGE
jgi:hypothetical protein